MAKCPCGRKRPCELHDVTPEMKNAMLILQSLKPEQRTRIFCWFCVQCGEEIPPGGSHSVEDPHVCGKCGKKNKEEADGT